MLLPHNKKYFNEIKEAYKKFSDLLFVHGTGLGKSFIFLECAKTLFRNKKILFIVPKIAVGDGISGYDDYQTEDADITFKTYNYFKNEERVKEAYDSFDVFVFDEAHHLGSDHFGENARKLFPMVRKNGKKRILGLTATNLREDKIDVASFFSDTILGMSIFDAIRTGLIPSFEYLICRDEVENYLMQGNKLSGYKKIVDFFRSVPLLKETVRRNPKKRWICFFHDIKTLESHEKMIRKMFPEDYKILKITTKHSTMVNEIEKYDKTVTLSVDKLLEGVHVPHTQGIILFRNVRSLPVFQQILGRVVHVGDEEHPLVLDCTKAAIRILKKLLKEDRKKVKGGMSNGSDTRQLLYCGLENTEHFNLTRLLAISDDGSWEDDEVEILINNYHHKTSKEMQELLPKRTWGSIRCKAIKLGLTESRIYNWSDDELKILKENAEGHTITELRVLLPDKKATAIKSKCKMLGYVIKRVDREWTDEEVRILKANADKMTWAEMVKLLPNRTRDTIRAKANSLGYDHQENKGWSKEQEEYLKKNYLNTDIDTVCKHIRKKKPAIRLKARQLGLFVGAKRDLWTDDKVRILKERYLTMDRNELARVLGVGPRQVTSKAAKLGLRKR